MNTPSRASFEQAYVPLLRQAGLDSYEAVMACQAGQALVKPGLGGRERVRLRLAWPDGRAVELYLKRYDSARPVLAEWRALHLVRQAGLPTMDPVGMGAGESGGFVLVAGVPGEALSRCLDDLRARFARDPAAMAELAEALGRLAGRLHAAGLAHRDFYTAHVFCDVPAGSPAEGRFDLYLIDLARVFAPRWRRWRWWLKDLAALKYSLDADWAKRHWSGVIAAYQSQRRCRLPLGAARRIDFRVRRLHRKAVARASRP